MTEQISPQRVRIDGSDFGTPILSKEAGEIEDEAKRAAVGKVEVDWKGLSGRLSIPWQIVTRILGNLGVK